MRPWYAINARNLLDMRKQGKAPAGPVVVSMIGGSFHEVAAMALQVKDDMPLDRMDWRMLVNLEVWLWTDASVDLERLLQVCDAIAKARPKRLVLRFDRQFAFAYEFRGDEVDIAINTHDVEVGRGFHFSAVEGVPETHEFMWEPTTHFHTPIERQLRAALLGKHPMGAVL